MAQSERIRPTHSVLPGRPPLLTPHPAVAPLIPPAHVVDLMTDVGSAVFGAQWRAKEAKLVECPALADSRPEFKTTYDVEPHAEERGYDDSGWEAVPANRSRRPSRRRHDLILLVPRDADNAGRRRRF